MDDDDTRYYESVDMDDAVHEQTTLAYEMNDRPLPVEQGVPLRLRVERQLGYKMAKYVMPDVVSVTPAGTYSGELRKTIVFCASANVPPAGVAIKGILKLRLAHLCETREAAHRGPEKLRPSRAYSRYQRGEL